MTTIFPPCVEEPWYKYKDKTFQEWQILLEQTWHSSDTEQGWLTTLEIIQAYKLSIPHVECGIMDLKCGTRRKTVRSWLMGYACEIPEICQCFI